MLRSVVYLVAGAWTSVLARSHMRATESSRFGGLPAPAEPRANSIVSGATTAMDIYKGVWYDHATRKLVLTLSPGAAGFLTAAVVTWVNICAAATWPIFRYILYSVRRRVDTTKDVFYHQRQALLRNSTSATNAATLLIKLIYGWKSYRGRAVVRSIAYLSACVVVFALWLLCGLYAPYIYTKTGSDVLLASSPHCGLPVPPFDSLVDDGLVSQMFQIEEVASVTSSRGYVQQCYEQSNSSSAQCTTYPRRALPIKISDTVCPFGTNHDICTTINSTTVQLDTGFLDSNTDFGVNAMANDRLKYRKVASCSPFHAASFVSAFNTSGTPLAESWPPNTVLDRFYLGPLLGNDFTFQYAPYQALFPLPYYLSTQGYFPGALPLEGSWQLNKTFYGAEDADITIAYLESNSVTYPAPVYDPIFAAGIDADERVSLALNSTYNFTVYEPHYSISLIGCTEQYQICLGEDGACTPLVPMNLLLPAMSNLKGLRLAHTITAGRFSLSNIKSSISTVASIGGANALLASRTLDDLEQMARLPKDQWRREVTNWFAVGLAQIQAKMLAYATGPNDPAFYPYLNVSSAGYLHGCGNQRIHSASGQVNFDLAALIILIAVGAAFIVFGLAFESVMDWITKRRPQWRRKHAAWVVDGLFQIQKRALEAEGIKDWQFEESEVPISKEQVGLVADEGKYGHVHVSESLLNEPKR
ncbi:Hypothetical predicted protein [Lecanosticta acicola]|uniref:Uncharacterized protein n=1 Tax=Lecanosticta acicola TaxID=111012 RepID=A0AAI8Z8T3_9PEZI|nr:Hypothetical predicted protein [Lecanosticta acicola]